MKCIIGIVTCCIIFAGCKKDQLMSFCEGKSKEGAGINCGKKFTTGDLMALIKLKEPFGQDRLSVSIIEKKKFKDDILKTFSITVGPGKKDAAIDLSLYTEGIYRIVVTGADKNTIAEGSVEIKDTD